MDLEASSPPRARPQRKLNLTLDLDYVNSDEELTAVEETSGWSVGFAVTYGFFFFVGASCVAMWSSITLCLDFFTQKYPDDRVGFVFPVVNMSTLLVISLFMVLVGRQLPLEARVHGSIGLYLAFMVVLPLVNILPVHCPAAYALTIIALVGSTISSSILQSTVYGLAGIFGPLFIQALDGGKGFCAILLFLVRLGLKWYFELPASDSIGSVADPEEVALRLYYAKISMGVFFAVSFLIVAINWVLYAAMKCTQYAQPMLHEYTIVQHETPVAGPVFSPTATPLTSSPRKTFMFPSAVSERSPMVTHRSEMSERSPLLGRRSEADSEATTVERIGRNNSMARSTEADTDFDDMEAPETSSMVLTVFRTAAIPFFTLFLSYFVCLSCFPGLISAIPSTTLDLADWFPIVLVGCYNLGDLVGKNLPIRVMYFDVTTLHLPWCFQLAFLPFFLAALVRPFSDVLVIVAVVLLGLTTGYVATSAMILAPSVCSEYQKEVAGMIASLCAIIGLCAGSYNGLALETLIQLWQDWYVVE
ncbi:hypothetical protein Poli38472_006018 [Pythium oligandrum]|uniref:Uncharacterized protein n=1 Tax=Pythium oligandrum TaxID=41045 RepID=A0A8K1FLS0_PYTOL|nr:hypothetical protein Poli38472_006018 [Pythium oligandrum]|eukprot:TMW68550.1 hypothetical protein Poli38472_006018 [Pythium oligandrum]